jgi:2-polyprenyl-3-methyl-5-hydroxy-6-metoxy-1,4-benzoquinol methylase
MNKKQSRWNESFKTGRDYNPVNVVILDLMLAEVKNKKVAIDLGCGTGDGVVKLAMQGMFVIGVDWSSDALEKARVRASESNVIDNVNFIEIDLNNLNEANLNKNSADVILCKLVVAFIEDTRKFLECAKSLLNKDGFIFLQTPVLYDSIEYKKEDKPNIAVKYHEFGLLLREVFTYVTEFNHSYYNEKGDLVTYLLR